MFHFQLSSDKLDSHSLTDSLESAEAGAAVTFEGRVRNHNDGKAVLRLEYEAYAALAQKEAEQVIAEARRLFPVLAISCVHRVGKLEIGELAVWVGVLGRHRGEAFDACRYVIDQIKARVPIWKKEFYADGSSIWVNCAECSLHVHATHEPHASRDLLASPDIDSCAERRAAADTAACVENHDTHASKQAAAGVQHECTS